MPLRLSSVILPFLGVATLAACQPTSGGFTAQGQETLDACVVSACETLNLDGMGLRDYGQINGLSHVTSLMVSYTDFSDLGDVADMGQLRELHMGSSQVSDLGGLAAMPNLEVLHAQFIAPQSFAPIAQLTGLRELAVGSASFNDLSFVADMQGLQRLLVTNSVADLDLAALGGHRGLRTVELRASDGLDLAPLLTLPNLREVSLSTTSPTFGPTQTQVIAQLRARGVTVELEEILLPVC